MRTRKTPKDRHLPEYALAAFFLFSFLVLLLRNYSMKVWSDPVHWFTFGVQFPERFASSNLAYGFPLLVHLAVGWIGPYHGFLVNIPVLVLMVGAFIAFAWVCGGRDLRGGWPTALAAAGIFVLLNRAMLIELASPYRDPLAFLFMLLAALLFVMHFEAERPRWAALAASGLCLAYAVSCRETSGLVAAPLLLYVLAARFRKWDRRFWMSLAWFGLFLFLGSLPWLVQNYLVSGNPVVPSQSAKKVERAASLLGMIPSRRTDPHVLPTLSYLRDHYTTLGVVATVIGLVTAVRTKKHALYLLCAPAIVVYFLFYMLYIKIVPRYLLVIDFFMVPLAAYGVVVTLRTALTALRPSLTNSAVRSMAATFTIGVGLWMLGTAPAHQRFLPAHARAFVEEMEGHLEPGSIVLCERPVEGLLQCFGTTRAEVLLYVGRHRVYQDPARWEAVHLFLQDRPAYLASMSSAVRRYVEREFDLEEELVLAIRRFNLDEWFTSRYVRLDRIRPWSATETAAGIGGGTISGPEQLLEVDVGHLAAYDRERIELSVDHLLLDEAPRDNMNYYELRGLGGRAPGQVKMVSDGPLPGSFRGRILAAGDPISMALRNRRLVAWRDRFSEAWLTAPRDRYPSVAGDGQVTVPTPGTNDWAIAFQLTARNPADEACYVAVSTDDGSIVASATVVSDGWTQIPVYLPRSAATGKDTVLGVSATGPDQEPQRVWLRQIFLQPLRDNGAGRRIEVGLAPADAVHLGGGFYEAERGALGPFRWTAARATAHFFLPTTGNEVVLSVTYRDPHPPGIPPAELACMLNGEVLRTTKTVEAGEVRTWSAIVPASFLRRGVNTITIGTRTWVPAEEVPGNSDDRSLGVQVRELRLSRPNPPDPASDGSTAAVPG